VEAFGRPLRGWLVGVWGSGWLAGGDDFHGFVEGDAVDADECSLREPGQTIFAHSADVFFNKPAASLEEGGAAPL